MVRLKAGRGSRPQIKDYTFILARQKKRVQTDRFAAQRRGERRAGSHD
jgi:hypothetical protein